MDKKRKLEAYEDDKQRSDMCPDRTMSDFYCSICDAHMNSEQMWESHVSGKRHLKNIKKEPGEMPSKVRAIKVNTRAKLMEITKSYPEPLVGLSYMTELQRADPGLKPSYTCHLCQANCTWSVVMEHILGTKHRLAYLKVVDPRQFNYIESLELTKTSLDQLAEDSAREYERKSGHGTMEVKLEKPKPTPLPPKREEDHPSAGPSRSISLESHHERHNRSVSPPKYSHRSRAGSPSRYVLRTPSRSPLRYRLRSESRSPPRYTGKPSKSRSPPRYVRRPTKSRSPPRYARSSRSKSPARYSRSSRSKSPARYVRRSPTFRRKRRAPSVDEKWSHDLYSPDGTPPPRRHSERPSRFDASSLKKAEKVALIRKLMHSVIVMNERQVKDIREVVYNLGQNMLEYEITKLPGTIKNKIAKHLVKGDTVSLERELAPILESIYDTVDCVSPIQLHRSSSSQSSKRQK